MPLIDRDALKKQMCKICNENYSDDPCEPNECVFRNAIDSAPTIDAVPVVRCKDCKHRGSDMCPMETVELYPWFGSKNDAFCSYGERRSDD